MGSVSDKDHVKKITSHLDILHIPWEEHVASAHKEPRQVLEIIDSFKGQKGVVFITVAGRSNALSGFVAANCEIPTLACPPFKDKTDMLVNIHSTIQMPSNVPSMTILSAGNVAQAAARILR